MRFCSIIWVDEELNYSSEFSQSNLFLCYSTFPFKPKKTLCLRITVLESCVELIYELIEYRTKEGKLDGFVGMGAGLYEVSKIRKIYQYTECPRSHVNSFTTDLPLWKMSKRQFFRQSFYHCSGIDLDEIDLDAGIRLELSAKCAQLRKSKDLPEDWLQRIKIVKICFLQH